MKTGALGNHPPHHGGLREKKQGEQRRGKELTAQAKARSLSQNSTILRLKLKQADKLKQIPLKLKQKQLKYLN